MQRSFLKTLLIGLLVLLPTQAKAINPLLLTTYYNGYTGRLDYVTKVDTNTFTAGSGIIITTTTSGGLVFNSTGGGGSGPTGQIIASPQYSTPYYSVTGTSNVVTGASPGLGGTVWTSSGTAGPPYWAIGSAGGGSGTGFALAVTTGPPTTYSNPPISSSSINTNLILNQAQFGETVSGTTVYINVNPALTVVGTSTASLQTQLNNVATSTTSLAAFFPVKIGSGTVGPFDVSATSASVTGAAGIYVRYNLTTSSITTPSILIQNSSATVLTTLAFPTIAATDVMYTTTNGVPIGNSQFTYDDTNKALNLSNTATGSAVYPLNVGHASGPTLNIGYSTVGNYPFLTTASNSIGLSAGGSGSALELIVSNNGGQFQDSFAVAGRTILGMAGGLGLNVNANTLDVDGQFGNGAESIGYTYSVDEPTVGNGGLNVKYGTTVGSMTIRNIASGIQCLQANSSGNVTGSGNICGIPSVVTISSATFGILNSTNVFLSNLKSQPLLGTDSSGKIIADPGGSNSYIQNQTSVSQGAGFRISGNGATSGLFEAASFVFFGSGNFMAAEANSGNVVYLGYGANAVPSASGSLDLFAGFASGKALTSGQSDSCFGNSSCMAMSSGGNNTAIGYESSGGLTTGSQNTFVGSNSGYGNGGTVTGGQNTGIGYQVGLRLTSGSHNALLGSGSGNSLTSGVSNSCLGDSSCTNITIGSSNTAVGLGTANNGSSSSAMTYLGATAGATNSSDILNNGIAIGFGATVSSSFTAQIGGILGSGNEVNMHVASMTADAAMFGAGLTTCGDSTHATGYSATTGKFSCQTLSSGGGSSFFLAVTTGTGTTYSNPAISSSSANTNLIFNQSQFALTATNTTDFIGLNSSSVTLQGNTNVMLLNSTETVTGTKTFYQQVSFSSSITVTGAELVLSTFTVQNTSVWQSSNTHISILGSPPVLSGCGVTPSVIGADTAFTITGGTGAMGCTATFAFAGINTPTCVVSQQSMSLTNALSYTVSNAAVTLSQVGLGTGKIDVICNFHD